MVVTVVDQVEEPKQKELKFQSVGLHADQNHFETYLRGNVGDLTTESRLQVEKDLRQLEVDQKMGHGIYILTRPKTQ